MLQRGICPMAGHVAVQGRDADPALGNGVKIRAIGVIGGSYLSKAAELDISLCGVNRNGACVRLSLKSFHAQQVSAP